jgi:hypothetical protein
MGYSFGRIQKSNPLESLPNGPKSLEYYFGRLSTTLTQYGDGMKKKNPLTKNIIKTAVFCLLQPEDLWSHGRKVMRYQVEVHRLARGDLWCSLSGSSPGIVGFLLRKGGEDGVGAQSHDWGGERRDHLDD